LVRGTKFYLVIVLYRESVSTGPRHMLQLAKQNRTNCQKQRVHFMYVGFISIVFREKPQNLRRWVPCR